MTNYETAVVINMLREIVDYYKGDHCYGKNKAIELLNYLKEVEQ